jgi:hypothetical protein
MVFLRYAVDVPSYLFDVFELRLFLCHIRCVVFRCAYQVLPCVPWVTATCTSVKEIGGNIKMNIMSLKVRDE